MLIRKWDFIRDRYYIVEIPKTGPEPEDWGATSPVPVHPEETFTGFERQVQLRGERAYRRQMQRMKELGLLSNPGDIQEVWASQFQRIGGWWSDFWSTVTGWLKDIDKWIGPLGTLWDWLVEEGIVTLAERDTGEGEGWTKEDISKYVEAKFAAMQPAWEKYLPWVAAGGLGIGLILVLALRRPAPVYVATK